MPALLPDQLRRSYPLTVRLRPGEADDLATLAEAWGLGPAEVAWAIVTTQLARWRRRGPELGRVGLQLAAAVELLKGPHSRRRGLELDSEKPADGPW